MSDAPDFGYSQIEWENTNRQNVLLVEAEYRQRFEGTLAGEESLDKKGQYILTGLITLLTAILGLTFSQAKSIEPHYLIGLLTLASMFGLGSICASMSLYPRTYSHLGATPGDLNVAAWKPLLNGDEKDALRLSGIRIKEYARAISDHDVRNGQKSWWLRAALIATVLALPASIAATRIAFLCLTKAAVASPVSTVPLRSP